MPAFEIERLAFGERHRVGVRATGHRHRLPPFDPVRVQNQLFVPRLRVVEYRHRAVADDNQPLFLERVQPGDKDMRLLAARKCQMRRRDVGDGLVQVVAARRRHIDRLLPDE